MYSSFSQPKHMQSETIQSYYQGRHNLANMSDPVTLNSKCLENKWLHKAKPWQKEKERKRKGTWLQEGAFFYSRVTHCEQIFWIGEKYFIVTRDYPEIMVGNQLQPSILHQSQTERRHPKHHDALTDLTACFLFILIFSSTQSLSPTDCGKIIFKLKGMTDVDVKRLVSFS